MEDCVSPTLGSISTGSPSLPPAIRPGLTPVLLQPPVHAGIRTSPGEGIMLNGEYLHLRLHRLRDAEEFSHSFDGLCFVFPKGGHGHHANGGYAQSLAPGDVLIVRDGAGCKLTTGKGGDFVFWSFCLRPENLFPLFDGKEIALLDDVLKDFGPRKHYTSTSAVAADSHRLLAEVSPNPTLDHRGQLVRIAASILAEEFKQAHHRTGFVRAEEHIIQVFERLSSDEILSLSIDELATRFSCSRRHLNRLFHQFFGFSATALKTEMRLLRAASLLRNPNSKVITVAQQCGFNHLGLFNTTFRRRFGSTPGQWRDAGGRVELTPPALLKPPTDCSLRANGLCPWNRKVAGVDPSRFLVPAATNGNGNGNGNGFSNGGHKKKATRQNAPDKVMPIDPPLPANVIHPPDHRMSA